MKEYFEAFALAAAVSVAVGFALIPLLRKLKLGQNILSYVSEHEYKSGTPTFGGFIFIIGSLVSFFVFGGADKRLAAVCVAVYLLYAAVGFTDDFIKVKLKRNEGLSALQKSVFELVIAIIVSVFAYTRGLTEVFIPFTDIKVVLNVWLYLPLTILVFVATTNCVNLTDGLDGLAGGVTYVYFLCFAVLTALQGGKSQFALVGDEADGIALLSVCLSGALVGYLLFNTHKASVFMGDTGSLALGGAVAATAIVSGNTFYIPVIGIIYVCSGISVILQVAYFKITKGKRIFLMAPLHHHFQHKGYGEAKIAFAYKFVTLLAGLTAIILTI